MGRFVWSLHNSRVSCASTPLPLQPTPRSRVERAAACTSTDPGTFPERKPWLVVTADREGASTMQSRSASNTTDRLHGSAAAD